MNRVLSILVALGAGGALGLAVKVALEHLSPGEDAASAARAERLRPVLDPAPAPLPEGLPLRGPEGTDADGYPLRYVDAPALRSLLVHRRFAELTAAFEHFQEAFEEDPRHEYWPDDAATAFATADPGLRPLLDEWVAAAPESFAPYVARGWHLVMVAFAQRGGKWARDTHLSDFEAMRATLAEAGVDLDRALALRPRLLTARRAQINAFKLVSDRARMRAAIEAAEAACPTCLLARSTWLLAITPRWGGSYEEMRAYAASAPVRSNRKLAVLAGYEHYDRADMLLIQKRYDEALAALEPACALGDYWLFLLERAKIHNGREDPPQAALADLDRALELRPGVPELLFERAMARLRASRWEAAGADLLEGLRVDPTHWRARWLVGQTVPRLVRHAWELNQAGQRDDALRVIDLAAQIAPGDPEVQRWRARFVSPAPTTDGGIAALRARVRASPDDFRLHQQLDYALAREGRFEEVVKLWNGFLERHPEHGQAHLERGGAHFHLGRFREAHADARRACELGVNEGCLRAKQLAGR